MQDQCRDQTGCFGRRQAIVEHRDLRVSCFLSIGWREVQSAISALFRAIAHLLDVGIHRVSSGKRQCRLGVRSGQQLLQDLRLYRQKLWHSASRHDKLHVTKDGE